MAIRKASAVWNGGLKGGNGTFKTETGLSAQYSFGSRFENGSGSNPEELLAAAEAACFSMALGGDLEKNGTPATKVETSAAVTAERVSEKWTITRIVLTTRATVPNIDQATFERVAQGTKENCPVSRALKSVEIQLKAELA